MQMINWIKDGSMVRGREDYFKDVSGFILMSKWQAKHM